MRVSVPDHGAPLTPFPSALSGKCIPSHRILRLNFECPDSRSEKMQGNSQKVAFAAMQVDLHLHEEGVTLGADVVEIDFAQDIGAIQAKEASRLHHRQLLTLTLQAPDNIAIASPYACW